MKNLITTLLLLLATASLFAQIVRTGSFVENAAIYPISGDLTLTSNSGTITVDFENNFSTIQGITLEVFLSTDKNLDASDILISTAPLDAGSPMGTIISGPISFNVPAGINAYDYDNVMVFCTSANVLWGHANLCETNLNLASASLPTDSYTAAQNIASSATLASASMVSFETSNCIELNAGFCVPASTEFTTFLGSSYGCIIE